MQIVGGVCNNTHCFLHANGAGFSKGQPWAVHLLSSLWVGVGGVVVSSTTYLKNVLFYSR